MSERMIDGVLHRGGGVDGGRPLIKDDPFEDMLAETFGSVIHLEAIAVELYQALTNTIWTHITRGRVAYSFRAAADVIAALRGEGDYIDWYCCATPAGVVSPTIEQAMLRQGWTWEKHIA